MTQITRDLEMQQHDGWGGNLAAWLATTLGWTIAPMMPTIINVLTAVLTLTTVWWTVERARTERVKRRAYEYGLAESKPLRKSLLARFSTRPADLDEQSGHDNGAAR